MDEINAHLETALEEVKGTIDTQIYNDAIAVLRGEGSGLPYERLRRARGELSTLRPRVRYLKKVARQADFIVSITIEEAAIDDQDARRDHDRATKEGWQSTGYDPGTPQARLAYKARSYRAERAFAKFIGAKDWVRDPQGFGKPDVNGWCIRLATHPGYGLVLHAPDNEKRSPYLLMEDQLTDGRTFRVAGWIPFDNAWALRRCGIGKPLEGNTAPWAIPQDWLREWDQLAPPRPDAYCGTMR